MKTFFRSLLALSLLLGTAATAQAQAGLLVNGIRLAATLGARAAHGKSADKTVTAGTYRGQQFPMKRTPGNKFTGPAADQIAMLEGQLETCHAALLADSTGTVCPATQQANIQVAQTMIAKLQPGFDQRFYREEADFYLAEDARRQRVAGSAIPAK